MLISTPIPADPAHRAQVLASRAAAGAAALDARQPGWAARVDPDQIDLASDGDPLTLLYGDFHDGLLGLVHADPDPQGRSDPYGWAVTHGFDIDASTVDLTAYAELDACWRTEVTRRRIDRIVGEAR